MTSEIKFLLWPIFFHLQIALSNIAEGITLVSNLKELNSSKVITKPPMTPISNNILICPSE